MTIGERITLSDLNRKIGQALETAFPLPVWLVAEINEMHINRSGHCYMELVEKSEQDDRIVAKNRATVWAYKFRMLKPYFESTTGTKLESGIKVLLKAEVSFHELYGLSLNISDIDPSYTLGDLAMKKQEVIRKLKEAGVIDMNRDLVMNPVPQKIAVISSETAAGYGDFMHTLLNNHPGFAFTVTLFPAIVQGEAAEASIIAAFEQVFESGEHFDAVALIRGGGSKADLDCFNGYELAMNIAQFPVPVLTGIGHERDETIADMVAHRRLKTPTAVAEFLVDRLSDFEEQLGRLEERFGQAVHWILQQERLSLKEKASDLHHLARQFVSDEKHAVSVFRTGIITASARMMKEASMNLNDHSKKLRYLWKGLHNNRTRDLDGLAERHRRAIGETLRKNDEQLRNMQRSLQLLRPEKVLARGYSLTYANGKIIKSVVDLEEGQPMETRMSDGRVESKISGIRPDKSAQRS